MFLIMYKKGLNSEKSKIEFDRPLNFVQANEMLLDAVERYKQTGQKMKVSYKIINIESEESVFNSKILIDGAITSLYQLIKKNSNAPRQVVDYVSKVENRDIIESDDIPLSDAHIEEKNRLAQLQSEKNEIIRQLKLDEKERIQRDIEHQKMMRKIQEEKLMLEKSLQLKEKEEAEKEAQRLESIRLLEEEKNKAMKLMEEKRNQDRRKKEEHEKRLREVEEDKKRAEIELASFEAELEMKNLERKKELQKLEEMKRESDRKATILKAESDKDDLEYQNEIIQLKQVDTEMPVPLQNSTPSFVVPKLTLKERIQELDYEKVKELGIRFIKYSINTTISGSKKLYVMFKEYREELKNQKLEKEKARNRQLEIEEKIAEEKIKFIDELKKDREKQEKEIEKAVKEKEKEMNKQIRIEQRYLAAIKKKPSRKQSGSFLNNVLKIGVGLLVVVLTIHFFDLGNVFPVLQPVQTYIESLLNVFLVKLG